MSIILKGIDLDEITAGNGYARLEIEEDGTVVDDISDIIIAQAIQIDRPHGRLIDGDKLLKEYKQWLESVPYINNTMSEMGQRIVLIDICHDLEYSAPTILEAE